MAQKPSVVDPVSLSRIPDPNFFYPLYEFFHPGSQIRLKEFKSFNPKKWFLSSRKFDLGCWSRIQGSKQHRIPDDPDPQHCKNLWIRNNAHRSEGGYDLEDEACAPTAGRRGTGSPPLQVRLAPAGPSRAAPQGCSAGSCSQGWKKPVFYKKKPSPVVFFRFFGFLGFFWIFWGFFRFFYIFAQKREFLGFFHFQEYF